MKRSSVEVPRCSGLTRADFLAAYLQPELPVVLTDQASAWPAMTRWQPAELIRRHGDRPIRAYSHPEGMFTALALHQIDTTLGAVLTNGDPRTFGVCDLMPECPYLIEDVAIPDVVAPEWVVGDASVWFQPHGHRTGLHWDTYNSVLTVIHGEKRVLMFAPEAFAQLYPCTVAGGTDFARASWSQVDIFAPDHARFPAVRDAAVTEVTVRAGETLVIPRQWWHAVENVGRPTIAMSMFVVGQGKPELTFYADRRVIAGLAQRLGRDRRHGT